MNIVRDFALVIGGALVALAIQPSVSVSQSDLATHTANLTAISNVMRVDQAGNVRIAPKGNIALQAGSIAVQAGSALDLKGVTVRTNATAQFEVKAGGFVRVEAPSVDLHGTSQARFSGALTMIGRNNLKPAVTLGTPIVCGALHAPCTITPIAATVLIGQ